MKPTFQRKQYVEIAEYLLLLRPAPIDNDAGEWRMWYKMVRCFTSQLEADNPNFQRARFLEACGYAEE